MSFSEEVKDEIINAKLKKCCMLALRYGELSTESKELSIKQIQGIVKNKCCKKSYIKGVFMGSGTITNPVKEYHAEMIVKKKDIAEYIIKLLEEFMLDAKYIKRSRDTFVIYIKDSEKIVTLMAILEANKSLLKYENVRIEKGIKNDINRNVNCETANISKIIKSSYEQVQAINKIKSNSETYLLLKDDLKEVSEIRIKYPDDSLEELSEKFSKKISKSGIYHKLQKLIKIAKEM